MKWYWHQAGNHIHVRVFMNGAKCGELCFRVEEFERIQAACFKLEFFQEGPGMAGMATVSSCTCGEPHISNRIQHRYDGKPCFVKDRESVDGPSAGQANDILGKPHYK